MVTIRNNSLELQDGDTISVDGTELTFRSSGELEFPDGETAISLSDIDGADIAPNSVDAVTDVTTSNVTTDALEADAATIANRQVSNVLGAHDIRIEELLLNQGLDSLDFDGGFVEIYANQDRVDSSTNIEGFNGSISLTDGQTAGSLTTVFETLGFVPNSVVLNQTADVRQDVVAENGEQFEYAIGDSESVEDASLRLTGELNAQWDNHSIADVSDGDTLSVNIGGNSPPSGGDITFTGVEENSSQEWSYTEHSNNINDVVVDESTGSIYSVSDDGEIHATDASSGNQLWTWSTTNAIDDVVVDESTGTVYLTETFTNDLYALNGSTGGEKWTYSNNNYGVNDLAFDESAGIIYMGAGNYVLAIDTSGNELWTYGFNNDATLIEPDESTSVVYTVSATEEIHALDALSGDQVWTQTDFDHKTNDLAVDEESGTIYVGTYQDTHAIDTSTGNRDWLTGGHSGHVSEVGVDESSGTIYTVSGGVVNALDSGGNQQWTYSEHTDEITEIAVDDSTGTIYTSSVDSEVHAIESDGNRQWTYTEHSNAVNDISLTDSSGAIYSGSADSEVHAIEIISETTDPSVDINNDGSAEASYSGTLSEGETHTETVSPSLSDDNWEASLESGRVDVEIAVKEITETQAPSVELTSDDGSQTIDYSGTLADGETVDLSGSIDESLIGGDVTVSVNVSEDVTDPVGQVGLEYRHEGMDAGGIINYTIEDGDGNSKRLPIDTETDISSFTSEDVRLLIDVFNGLANVTSSGFGVYLDGGN